MNRAIYRYEIYRYSFFMKFYLWKAKFLKKCLKHRLLPVSFISDQSDMNVLGILETLERFDKVKKDMEENL